MHTTMSYSSKNRTLGRLGKIRKIVEKITESMEECRSLDRGAVLQGFVIQDLQFAYDIDLLAKEESQLQIQLTTVCQAGEDFRLHINMDKTKVMSMGNNYAARIGL
jgi:hypothetical protein